MAIQSSGNKGLFTEINITPLTDIFLVLLIIMMVIAPMFQKVDNNILLPSVNSGLSVDKNSVTIAITQNAQFYVNSQPVAENQLVEKLAALLPDAKDKKVVVMADGKTKTKYIMNVMKAAQDAGYEKLTVAGEPLSKQKQNELESGDKVIKTLPGEEKNISDSSSETSDRRPVDLPQ